jgi:hypothetical protein
VTPAARRAGAAAGYSATPLAEKLGIGEGTVVALVRAPAGWTVPALPPGARLRRRMGPDAGVVILFVRRAAELAAVPALVGSLGPQAALWITWPRRAAGHDSDVSEHDVRRAGLATGLVDVKVAAVGEDWSGLRFVRRRAR